MKISRLYIDTALTGHPEATAISQKLGVPVTFLEDPSEVYAAIHRAKDPILKGKQILWLTRNKGAFIKSCPGTKAYTCCGYKILHVGSYCDLDCSYCILQAYFHPAVLQWFVNYEDLYQELDRLFAEPRINRIGTGEFTDSLIWEPWVDLNQRLIERFAQQNRAVLELKTKTTAIDRILNYKHNRKTILAWSLNTPSVIKHNERRTSSLTQRLNAARACAEKGYPVAFHFDPMVVSEGCETSYRKVVSRIFEIIDPRKVVWISMGAFRYIPSLKSIIEQRFPNSKLPYGEFIAGEDGKMRYFKPLRVSLFKSVADCIRSYAPQTLVYLCMEDREVWESSLGYYPGGDEGLASLLDRAAQQICGLERVPC